MGYTPLQVIYWALTNWDLHPSTLQEAVCVSWCFLCTHHCPPGIQHDSTPSTFHKRFSGKGLYSPKETYCIYKLHSIINWEKWWLIMINHWILGYPIFNETPMFDFMHLRIHNGLSIWSPLVPCQASRQWAASGQNTSLEPAEGLLFFRFRLVFSGSFTCCPRINTVWQRQCLAILGAKYDKMMINI